jgi:mRNA-degrading endonuclease toxin of MazEF toxin-antitoxin module
VNDDAAMDKWAWTSSSSTISVLSVPTVMDIRPMCCCRAAGPGNVAVPSDVSGQPEDSVVNVTQIATVGRSALEDRVGALPDWLLAQVEGDRSALSD